ncbi:MAG: hypothetical protein AABX05_02980, partial [Nanoarchaeota archaeon]
MFSLFFFLWAQFLFFKRSLLKEGISFIWQNVPTKIISEYFPRFSIGEALLVVSIIPFLCGAFVVYRSLFETKNQRIFLLIGLVIAAIIMTWLRIIRFTESLAFFAVILAVLFSLFYGDTEKYVRKTRLAHYKRYLLPLTLLLLMVSTVIPAISASLNQGTPTEEELAAFLQELGQRPEAIRADGGLQEILTRREVLRIRIDEKIYVAKD